MGVTAISGPFISYGVQNTSSGATLEYNEERGPSIFDLGSLLQDPRPNFDWEPGQAAGTRVYGWWDNAGVVDAVPSVQNSSVNYIPGAIVSCAVNSSIATTLTLNTSTVNGVTYNAVTPAGESAQNVTMTMAIDYTTPYITYGSAGTVAAWNPANAIARCVVVSGTTTSSKDDSGVTVSVYGRDIYGNKMTETITMSSLSQTAPAFGKKAFKYIQSVALVNSSLINSTNINIGFADKFGFPTRVDTSVYVQMLLQASSNSSTVTSFGSSSLLNTGVSSAGTAFALSTGVTATATTADPRGTWVSTTSWVANQRLQMYCTLNPANLSTITSTYWAGILGVNQYSSN